MGSAARRTIAWASVLVALVGCNRATEPSDEAPTMEPVHSFNWSAAPIHFAADVVGTYRIEAREVRSGSSYPGELVIAAQGSGVSATITYESGGTPFPCAGRVDGMHLSARCSNGSTTADLTLDFTGTSLSGQIRYHYGGSSTSDMTYAMTGVRSASTTH